MYKPITDFIELREEEKELRAYFFNNLERFRFRGRYVGWHVLLRMREGEVVESFYRTEEQMYKDVAREFEGQAGFLFFSKKIFERSVGEAEHIGSVLRWVDPGHIAREERTRREFRSIIR